MIEQNLKTIISEAFKVLYQADVGGDEIAIEPTSKDFEGDFTFVVFPFLKRSKKNPELTASEIGAYVKDHLVEISSFNVIKGFLNLSLSDGSWVGFLQENYANEFYGFARQPSGRKVLVEYSSPNTNKPLHLGHVRNNLLGYSVAQILSANGHHVSMCNLVNDRGIHICKSMWAWITFGNGETPESSGLKGDHLVGKYYVAFDRNYKTEIQQLISEGMPEEEAAKKAPAMMAAQELLVKWEHHDEETVKIWKMMNEWVYKGFDATYKKLGVKFDKFYYESDTYLLGKEIVKEGLENGAFFRKDDGSVWVDLTAEGLDEKLLLRKDGTSVYITQDLGTAELKYRDFNCDLSVYVVGNEQDYVFKVLKLICKKLRRPYADSIYHLSYGMVELPQGKMKSREGTVVDADDLMEEMILAAKSTTEALGKTEGLTEQDLSELYEIIGMGALKYFLMKVEPRKRMLFNPEESIDFHGNTGPFIQYTHARIRSILRHADLHQIAAGELKVTLQEPEKKLLETLSKYPEVIKNAGAEMSPGIIANHVYEIAKTFNQFYHECPILKEENPNQRNLRLMICIFTANTIKSSFGLLGIRVPERM